METEEKEDRGEEEGIDWLFRIAMWWFGFFYLSDLHVDVDVISGTTGKMGGRKRTEEGR